MRPSVPPPLPVHAQQGSVASKIRALPVGVRPSEVWRNAAFALLRLNPKECEELGLVFEEERTSDETRLLVLDLLAGAATFEAQVVMRRLLALAVARRNNRTFATFVQRLGFVEHPDGPTLRFLMSVYAESRGEPADVRAACAYALGAAAGQAYASGDLDAAVRASDTLRRHLLQAGTASEKSSLVTALGNAGLPTDAPVLVRFAHDSEAQVRAAAALALRKIPTPEARSQLVALLADGERRVAECALVALSEQSLEDDELDRLAELVLGGRTALALDIRILQIMLAQRPRLQPSPGRPTTVENALRLLLGRVEAVTSHGSGEHRFGARASTVPSWTGEHAAVAPPPPPPVPPPPAPGASGSVPVLRAAAAGSGCVPVVRTNEPTDSTPTLLAAPPAALLEPEPPAEAPVAPPPEPLRGGPGAYRLVQRGDTVEQVRERLRQLGLDPDARLSIVPPPPQAAQGAPRRGSGTVAVHGGQVLPQAIVRRAR